MKKTPNTKPSFSIHGVLVDVYGVGVLIKGPSGVGKSECALDLVARGHRLVADDLVMIEKNSDQNIQGKAPELSQYYIEVRGLGLLNIRDLYGAAAIREHKRLDMVLELLPVDTTAEIDRLGIEMLETEILGTKIPWVRVPAWKGRNITTIIEVAARNQILRWSGKFSALEFETKQREYLCKPS